MKVHYPVHKSRHLAVSYPLYALQLFFFNIRFNIILASAPLPVLNVLLNVSRMCRFAYESGP
jgi:hypothetical protein